MASKTWFATNNLASVHQEMDETDPGAEAYASPVTGWIVSTGATNHSPFNSQVEQAAATFTATTDPDGTPDSSTGDCLRSAFPLTGTFASGNWNVHVAVRANTGATGQDGRMRCRLFKGKSPDGSDAVEITAAQQQGGLTTDLLTTVTQVSTATFNPGAFECYGEYIFVQLAWERTGAATMTNADVNLRVGNASGTGTRVISSDFTELPRPVESVSTPSPVRSLGLAGLTIALSLLQTTLAPVQAQTVYYTSQTTILAGSKPAPSWEPPNLLQSTLAPAVVEVPFVQSDWPIPRGAVPPHVGWVRDGRMAEDVELAVRPLDWPLPAAPGRISTLTTWTQARPSFYEEPVGPAPFVQTDWPLPVTRRSSLLVTVFTRPQEDAEKAIRPLDWPMPRPGGPPPTLHGWTHNRPAYYVEGPVLPPFTPIDWPNPAPARTLPTLRTWTQAKPTYYVDGVTPPPITWHGWEIPRAPRQPVITARTHAFYYVVDETAPAPSAVFVLPRQRAAAPPTWTWNLLETTLAPPPAPKPHLQPDWPLPQGKGYPVALRTATNTRQAFHVDESPKNQYDWPTPPPWKPAPPTWTQNLLQFTLAPAPPTKPHLQADWPLPQGKGYPVALRTATNTRQAFHVDARLVGQARTELPRTPAPPPYTWTQNLVESTLAPATIPINQTDWPLPTGTRPAIGLRTHTDGRKAYHVDESPKNQYDWPNPEPWKPAPPTWTRNLLQSTLTPPATLNIVNTSVRSLMPQRTVRSLMPTRTTEAI